MTTRTHEVIVIGGGPTGMVLAAELALAGVDVALVERRAGQELAGARAGGLHARTLELFDQRGIAGRFLAQGQVAQVNGFAWMPLDISDFPSRFPHGLALWQSAIEATLAAWVAELPVTAYRTTEVTGVTEDEDGVTVETSVAALRARYVVGCDGGRSVVRKSVGIGFPGTDATISHIIAEVEVASEPPWGMRHDADGINSLMRMGEGQPVRVMVTERQLGATRQPTLDDLRAALVSVYGDDFGVHSPRWISRFTDAARQAETYRSGRVLLAGDAAHVHYPVGGQGLNIGVADAFNLGWKLALVTRSHAPDALLDTYTAERHPVAAAVLRDTRAQVALLRHKDQHLSDLREIVGEFLAVDEVRKQVAGRMSGLSLRYDLGDGHPLLGRRMPDLELETTDGPTRVYPLLQGGRGVLLDFGDIPLGVTPDARVAQLRARTAGPWDLPVIGAVSAPGAVLIRPDGYVAWVGEGSDAGLATALTTWFGLPRSA